MSDIEKRVRDALRAERTAHDEAAPVSYETRRSVMARMKTKDRVTFSVAGVLAAAAVASLFFFTRGDGTLGQQRPQDPIAPAATGTATPQEAPTPDETREGASLVSAAVWPETTQGSAARACKSAEPWRAQRQGTVGRFASEFLGLESPIIRRIEGEDLYAVSAGLDGGTQVQVGQFGAPGCWSVTAASAPEVADVMSYEVRKWQVEVVFDTQLSAIELYVARGGGPSTAGARNADRVTAPISKRGANLPGSWIAVLKASDGEILGAWAATFPPGESAAG